MGKNLKIELRKLKSELAEMEAYGAILRPYPDPIPEFGLPETVRETFPNTDKLAGTFVVYCIGDEIEIKARGLSPRQLLKIFGLLISKMF